MTFLDDTPDEFDRHDMEADAELDRRAEAESEDYEFRLECLIARELNEHIDLVLG